MNSDGVTLDQAIDTAMKLSPEQQDILLDVLQRRRIEARRLEIAADAWASIDAFRDGHLISKPVDKILKELHESLVDEP